MKCPYCESPKSKVCWTEEKTHESLPEPVRQRRRQCLKCQRPFQTYEVYSLDFRRMLQVMESADLLEELSGTLRTRLNLKPRKTPKPE